MKANILIMGLLALGGAVSGQGTLTVKGHVKGDLKGEDRIYFTDLMFKDSVRVQDGQFTYTMPVEKPVTLYVYTGYHFVLKQVYSPTILVIDQPGTVQVDFDIDGDFKGTVSGYATAEEFVQFQEESNKLPAGADLSKEARDEQLRQAQARLIRDIVKKAPDKFSTAYILDNYTSRMEPAVQEELYKALGPAARKTVPGQSVKDRLDGYRNSALGREVMDFSLPDDKGVSYSIRSLRGKYVIIDFWASWCAPCRASIPHLKNLYEKYKSKGLEVLSVSIDTRKDDWNKALKVEQMPWKQLLDQQNVGSKGFALTAIPLMFLLGPDGKILVRQLGSDPDGKDPIEEKLKVMLN